MSTEKPMMVNQATDPEMWVDQHGDYLFRYALQRVRDHTLAEDLVQETFLAALKSRSSFAGQSSERTWLVGILKHKIIDSFRRTSRERPTADIESVPDDPEGLFDANGHWKIEIGPVDWAGDPRRVVEQREFRAILERCMMELPTRLATAFSLREMEELSTEEICKVLSVSANNLWVMLHRARAHLRHCLEVNWFGQKKA